MDRAGIEMEVGKAQVYLNKLTLEPTLRKLIEEAQLKNLELIKIKEDIGKEEWFDFRILDDGILRFQTRVCVPNDLDIRRRMLTKVHQSLFTVHLGNTKIYWDLQDRFWWIKLKKDVAQFVE